ncbi:T9SS type A sorting domain-containing protein [bacterium]|nr:MAG: T9SS type A sorting domain-containing protein [bacterium]
MFAPSLFLEIFMFKNTGFTPLLLSFILTFSFSTVLLQAQDSPKYEYRGAWIATVYNLDWPSSASSNSVLQKMELDIMLDKFKEAGINAVYFQVRTAADALYESNYEPWSQFVSGQEGTPPNPYYDPLQYAIEGAHKRGLELHAWLNPYRALRSVSKSSVFNEDIESINSVIEEGNVFAANSNQHVSVTHPEWILKVGTVGILDPGQQEVIDYIGDVVMDIVNRYDVDGIHFDDYFYPYPPNSITNEDAATFAAEPRGFENINDWRRNNVNLMIESVNTRIKEVKSFVDFGISPFGIWKSGVPQGSSGMSAYSAIYADALAWIDGNYVDYLVPQLYWKIEYYPLGTDFNLLSDWWAEQVGDIHLYTGHGLYRADGNTYSGTPQFNADEIPKQIRRTRSNDNILGSVFFRARNISQYNSKGITDSLKNNYYKRPALTPSMSWKTADAPSTPQNLSIETITQNEDKHFKLTWNKSQPTTELDSLVFYAVYRVTSNETPDFESAKLSSENLIYIAGDTTFTDKNPGKNAPNWYFVTAFNRNSIESSNSNAVDSEVITSNETDQFSELPSRISLEQNYPNPFNPETQIRFTLSNASDVNLSVYNVLGQPVEVLLSQQNYPSGTHSVSFNAAGLPSGMYFYRLNAGNTVITKKMMLIK